MSTRKYESGYSKLKKKKRVEALIESQKRALDKFVKTNKKSKIENTGDCSLNEQVNNVNHDENENREEVVDEQVNNIYANENREGIAGENETRVQVNMQDNSDSDTHNEDREEVLEKSSHKNIYDPSQWTTIDTNLRDLLVKNGPIKITDIDFPKDVYARHFSSSLYIQQLSNGEKRERRWLVYSQNLDKVFCFCCKLFNALPSTSKLAHEGSNDWRNISAKLKSHETSNDHIVNMSLCIDLEMRLLKHKTIDKNIQERINREREHWRNLLLRIIAVVKTLDEIIDDEVLKTPQESFKSDYFLKIKVIGN
ncbi:uncharacterized protein LOC131614583 [Vicia villosa]|uniref:uncharacterized protein LOC131614583 n=1 Tax=Vicia villosa TaxID=3911 RepID=UPI00273CE4F4|nr:uncharacterized protein LOC131614583 [Vicia villosa]